MLKYLLFACLGICLAGYTYAQPAQDISGSWYGFFRTPQGSKQRLQLQFTRRETGGYRGQMKSPDVTTEPIDIDSISVAGDTLRFSINRIHLAYTGAWSLRQQRYNGYFEQLGNRAELNLGRKEIQAGELPAAHPQEPTPPFAYDVEEVQLVNREDKVLLAGTFTKPAVGGPFPVAVLISGSGPQDRDGEIVGHKPFAVIADYLAKHGMAALRLDDRGVGGSTGSYDSSGITNFAGDVKAAVEYLRKRKDVDTTAIGLLGHGEGGNVAQIAAAGNPAVAFVITMGTPGLGGLERFNSSLALMAGAYGESPAFAEDYIARQQPYFETLTTEKDTALRRQKAYASLAGIYRHFAGAADTAAEREFVESTYREHTTAEMLSLFRYDPAVYLARIKCPVLALYGSRDTQVDADLNMRATESALLKGGNERVTTRKFFGLNHLFQRCNTGRIEEYGTLDETINPAVLEFITRWTGLILEAR